MIRLLQINLLLNVVLLGLVWLRPRPEPPMPRVPRGEFSQHGAGRLSVRVTTVEPKDSTPATVWAGVESTDTRQFIANLRALGCPEDTIRDLVVTRVCRAYRSRLLDLQAEAARSMDITKGRSQQEWRETNQQQRRLRDQMNDELEDLLGQPTGRLTTALLGWPVHSEPPYLSLEKRRQVRDIERRYEEQTQELNEGRIRGGLGPEDRARLRDLRQQKEAEITALLTPAEREERLCRESDASRYVRQHLPQARSEAEFRDMVRLAAEFDLANMPASVEFRYGFPGVAPDEETAEYQKRKSAFDQRLKETLGDERIAEQQAEEQARAEVQRQREEARHEEQARREFAAVAEKAGVAGEDADRFFQRLKELQPGLESRFEELEKQLTGTPEEKHKQLQATVEAELEQIAVEIMGEKGREFVRQMKEREGRP